jgi:hypothetical protein
MTETIEIENFNVIFSFDCPKCAYHNDEISLGDLANGSTECGMCDTIFKIEGIDTLKITATIE